MRNHLLRYGGLLVLLAVAASAQDNLNMQLANLRQDVTMLNQRLGELTMTVEQLSRENAALHANASQNFATLEQLNRAIAEMNRNMQTSLAEQRRDTLNQVSAQLERLAKQTQAAIDAVARNQATRPAVQSSFSENFPKEGINYTVQSGDSLSGIAQKTGAKMQDIINANKISDPTLIRVGQTLFIPQGK